MTIGFLDTNILIGYFAGDPAIKAAMERFAGLKLPATAYTEFMVGVKSADERAVFQEILRKLFDIVQTDLDICHEAADLRRQYRMKLPDATIYATARIHGGTLISRNIKDFNPEWEDVYSPDKGE